MGRGSWLDEHADKVQALQAEFLAAHEKKDVKRQREIVNELAQLKRELDALGADHRAAMLAQLERAHQAITDDERVAQLVKAFELGAKYTHFAADELGDIDISNEAVDQTNAIANELDAIGSGRRSALAELLDHEDPGVRASAGAYLFKTMPERAVPVLRAVHEKDAVTSPWSTAHWALSEYDINQKKK
jgi:hypothetical protein